eukprot:TRINITY_DN43481_c0_g1_i1.p1 TRINITY_DN43481_c0_g1~~TRINITY_DN43481_c0_g1_i1.p1  ORF type:complete len:1114 (+),score=285.99 TRINITY_DN43481_c0_g1_i1:47-3388(+)
MVQCQQCRVTCVQDAKFCHACGAATPKRNPTDCSSCGSKLVPGATFCHICGTKCLAPAGAEVRKVCGCGAALPVGQATCAACSAPPPPRPEPRTPTPPATAQSKQPAVPSVGGGQRQQKLFGRQLPWWQRSVPWARDDAGARRDAGQSGGAEGGSRVPERITAPWLLHAGLAQDGSVDASAEMRSFANFVCATAGERTSRSTLRASVHSLALNVSPEATVKVIGGWATGLAAFDSGLDLVVESPCDDMLWRLCESLTCLGVTTSSPALPTGPVITFSATELAAAGRDSPSPGNTHTSADFKVTLRSGPPGSHCRAATVALNSLFAKRKQHRATAVVLRQTLRHFDAGSGGLGGHAVALMTLAYVSQQEMERGGDVDPGQILRGFFQFYSGFDYAQQAICCTPIGGTFFPPKPAEHRESAICIVDPADPHRNAAAHTSGSRLSQLCATLKYTGMLVHRYDFDSRNLPLLPNLIPAKKLIPRYEWLRATEGTEVTKELAVAVARGVADFLEDPSNSGAKEELLQLATWDTLQSILRDARVLRTVTGERAETTHSTQNFERLARALSDFSGDPEVRAQHVRAVGASVPPETVEVLLMEIYHFLQDPAAEDDKQRVMKAAVESGAWSVPSDGPDDAEKKARRVSSTADILRVVAARPGSVLKPFRNCIDIFTEAMDVYYDSDLLRGLVERCATAAVTRDVALAVATDAADFLEDPANDMVKERLMAAALNDSSENLLETHNMLLATMAGTAPAGSRLAMLKSDIPQLVRIVDSFHGDEEIDHQRRRAARACVTRDVTKAIAKEIASSLSVPSSPSPSYAKPTEVPEAPDLASQARPQAVWESVESRLSADIFARLAASSERLAAFRQTVGGTGGFQQLFQGMLAFRDEPELQELRSRAVAACMPGSDTPTSDPSFCPPPLLEPMAAAAEDDHSEALTDFTTPAAMHREGIDAISVLIPRLSLKKLSSALTDGRQRLLREYHESRRVADLDIDVWQGQESSSGSPRFRERKVRYAEDNLGFRVQCVEQQRLWYEHDSSSALSSVCLQSLCFPSSPAGVCFECLFECHSPGCNAARPASGVTMNCVVRARVGGQTAEVAAAAAAQHFATFVSRRAWDEE